MAFTFPLSQEDFFSLFAIESVDWSLRYFQERSGPANGEWLTHDLAPTRWQGVVTTIEEELAVIERWHARLNLLDGGLKSFYLHNPRAPYPATDPQGTLLASASVTIQTINANRKQMALAGLPAGFVVPWGCYASISAGSPSRTALVKFAEDATANGSGITGEAEFRPHLRPWVATGQAVTLIRPPVKAKLVPGSAAIVPVSKVTARLRFSVLQTLAAG